METTQFSFLSKDGKTTIHAIKWEPDNREYHAVLQISHGMVEYIERYAPFAEYLTERGFLVVGHDHIGHGHSVCSRSDWGYFAEQNPSDTVVEDIHRLRQKIQGENSGLPYFILGHSMGSFMLRKYLSLHGGGLSGAIVMGTGYTPSATTGMALTVVKGMTAVLGGHHRSPFVQKMIYGPSYKNFDTTGAQPEKSWLTRDVEIVKKYYAEPRCSYTFTLNGFQGLFEAVRFSCNEDNAKRIPQNLPMLIVSGDQDPVGDLGKGVKKVHQMYQQVGIEDLSCKLYPGGRHEILNELNRQQVFEDIYNWMAAHIA